MRDTFHWRQLEAKILHAIKLSIILLFSPGVHNRCLFKCSDGSNPQKHWSFLVLPGKFTTNDKSPKLNWPCNSRPDALSVNRQSIQECTPIKWTAGFICFVNKISQQWQGTVAPSILLTIQCNVALLLLSWNHNLLWLMENSLSSI